MFWIYFIGLMICGLVAGYFWKEIDDEELQGVVIFCGLAWPLLFALALLVLPFVGPVFVGVWIRNRRK